MPNPMCRVCQDEISKEEWDASGGYCQVCIDKVRRLTLSTPLERAAEILEKKAEGCRKEADDWAESTGDIVNTVTIGKRQQAQTFSTIAKALRGEE